MITQENFNINYVDKVEELEIDKFVCREMQRQVRRYIKGMSGSKAIMELFDQKMARLSLPEREEAIAQYLDLNRKALDGLDFKIGLTRAIANYCDTFDYLMTFIKDKRKWAKYLELIKEKYIRPHELFEENGLFGIKDWKGNVLIPAHYSFLRTPYVYVDDLCMMPVIAELNGKMGLLLPDGHETVLAPFEYDDISLRSEPPFFEAIKGDNHYLINRYGVVSK